MKKTPYSSGSHSRLAACRLTLGVPLGFMAVYAVLMMGFLAWSAAGVPVWSVWLWGLVLLSLGIGTLCLYRQQHVLRWGAVGMVLLLASGLTVFPLTDFLAHALQALGLAGLSLVFYDLENVFGVPLMLPGGLLFLAVVATVLNTPLMGFVGLALLTLSSMLALGRM